MLILYIRELNNMLILSPLESAIRLSHRKFYIKIKFYRDKNIYLTVLNNLINFEWKKKSESACSHCFTDQLAPLQVHDFVTDEENCEGIRRKRTAEVTNGVLLQNMLLTGLRTRAKHDVIISYRYIYHVMDNFGCNLGWFHKSTCSPSVHVHHRVYRYSTRVL